MSQQLLHKPDSGWVSEKIHAPLTRFVYPWLSQTGLSANGITLISLFIGLLSAYLISHADSYLCVLLSGLLWELFSIVDHWDGVVARMKNQQSTLGALFDSVVGHITYVVYFIGLSMGMLKVSSWEWVQWFLPVGIGLMGLILIQTYIWMITAKKYSLETYNNTFGESLSSKSSLLLKGINRVKYFSKGQFSRLLFCLLSVLNLVEVIYLLMVLGIITIFLAMSLTLPARLNKKV